MEFRHQVRAGQIKKAAGGQRQRGRQRVEQNRTPAAEAGVKQNAEIADLLRNFVKNHGDRGRQTDGGRSEKANTDDRAVQQIMETIGEWIEIAERLNAMLLLMFRLVAVISLVRVPPVKKFLQTKKKQNTGQDANGRGCCAVTGAENFRQQVNDDIAEQCACGEGD